MALEFTSFLSELKRRKVYSVAAAAYAAVGVAISVAVPDVFGAFGAPDHLLAHGLRGMSLAGMGSVSEARAEEGARNAGSLLLPFFRLIPEYRPLWDHPRWLPLMDAIWPGEQKRVLGPYGWQPPESSPPARTDLG